MTTRSLAVFRRLSQTLIVLNDNNNPVVLDIGAYFNTGGTGNNLTIYIQTAAGGEVSFAAADQFFTGGSNFAQFNLPADAQTLLDNISNGDRWIVKFARPSGAPIQTGAGEVGQATASAIESTGNNLVVKEIGLGEPGSVVVSGDEGQGLRILIKETGAGESGEVAASAIEGVGSATVPLPNAGSGEFAEVNAAGIEGTGASKIITETGSGEVGEVDASGIEGTGRTALLKETGSGEFGGVSVEGNEGAGRSIATTPSTGSGEFGGVAATGIEGIGRRISTLPATGSGEFGSITATGNESTGRVAGSLQGFTKIAEVRGISFPRTGLVGNASYEVILRARDKTGNTGDLVAAGTVLTEDLLDVPGAEFIFQRNNTGVVPNTPISSTLQRETDNYIPTGWTDNPQGVNTNNRYEYISSRTGSSGRWSEFGSPGLYNIFIGDTVGGLGYEFIYRLTNSDTTPATPNTNFLYRQPSLPWRVNRQSPTEATQFAWLSQRQIQGAPSTGDSISTAWSTPILVGVFGIQGEAGDDGIAGTDGNGIEFIYATTSTDSPPSNPNNNWGYDEPINPWNDGIPSNYGANNPFLWVATRVTIGQPATGDDVSGLWAPPGLLSRFGESGVGGLGFEFVYRLTTTDSTPASPTDSWRYGEPVNPWSSNRPAPTAVSPYVWQSHRPIQGAPSIGDVVPGAWVTPILVGIRGVDGEAGEDGIDGTDGATGESGLGIEFIYAVTPLESAPSNPNNNWGYDEPLGSWNDGVPSNYNDNNPFLWVSIRTTIGQPDTGDVVDGLWSAPALLSRFGVDGVGHEFIYAITSAENAPSDPNNNWGYDEPESPWFDDPPSTTISNPYSWRARRIIIGTPEVGDNVTALWTSPKLISRPGIRGTAGVGGIGAQFIFRRTTTASAPNTPFTTADQRLDDDYIPPNWTRVPTGVDATNPYEWVSSRTGMSEDWGGFSTPALWAAAVSARGPVPFFRAIVGSSWSNLEANLATTGDNVTGDRVTLYNATSNYTETRTWSGSDWLNIGKWIDGNLIVEGTVLSIFDIIAGAAVQSSNYDSGVAGWRISQDGDAEFDGVSIRGNITGGQISSSDGIIKTVSVEYVDSGPTNEAVIKVTDVRRIVTASSLVIQVHREFTIATCFPAGTPVLMVDGTWRAIELVKVGEQVRGRTRVNTVLAYDRVRLAHHRTPYLFEINGEYRNTDDHLTLTKRGWAVLNRANLDYIGTELSCVYDAQMNPTPMVFEGIAQVTDYRIGDEIGYGQEDWRPIHSIRKIECEDQTVYSLVCDGDGTMQIAGGYVVSAWVSDDKWNSNNRV